MSTFPKRQDFLPAVTGLALGRTVQFEIPRDFPVEAIFIRARVTQTGAIATASADGLLGIIKNIQLKISDGADSRNPVDCSGRLLLERHLQISGNLSTDVADAKDATTAVTRNIDYPLYMVLPQAESPLSEMFILPVTRYNVNPVLSITIASQSDIDVNGTPTFAATVDLSITVIRRQITVAQFPVLDWDLTEVSKDFTTTVTTERFELPQPGNYTGILIATQTSSSARGNVAPNAGTLTEGDWSLEFLSNKLRRFRLKDLELENQLSITPVDQDLYFAGSYYLDFLSDRPGATTADDLGSILSVNAASGTGARFNIIQNVVGGSGVRVRYLLHRVYGNLAELTRFGQANK